MYRRNRSRNILQPRAKISHLEHQHSVFKCDCIRLYIYFWTCHFVRLRRVYIWTGLLRIMKAHFTRGHYATPMVEISLWIRIRRRCLLFPAELASSKIAMTRRLQFHFLARRNACSGFIPSVVLAVAMVSVRDDQLQTYQPSSRFEFEYQPNWREIYISIHCFA